MTEEPSDISSGLCLGISVLVCASTAYHTESDLILSQYIGPQRHLLLFSEEERRLYTP